jgi:hypothetical protein
MKIGAMAIAAFLSAAVLSAGQVPKVGKVETVKDEKAAFASFATYAWEPGSKAFRPDVHVMIVDAIDAELAGRGLRKVDNGAASVTVRYDSGVRTDVVLDKFDDAMRANQPAPTKEIGRLIITMRDPSKHRVWAADTVQPLPADAALRKEMVRGVVASMYETYPIPKK